MESEKVKEIKDCLEEFKDDRIGYYTNGIDCFMLTKEDILTLINELESENERLRKERDKYIVENKDIEESNTYANQFLEKYKEKNKNLKDRIAELEHKCDDCAGCTQWKCDCANIEMHAVEQFAERLKEMAYKSTDWSHGEHPLVVEVDYIDEVLEEFLNK
jgi:DNA repair exonuclease SbcCD ATPase subunit